METEYAADLPRAVRAMREFLAALGVDTAAQGMEETPQRAAQLYAELFAGLHEDTAELWADVLTEETHRLPAPCGPRGGLWRICAAGRVDGAPSSAAGTADG